MVTTAGATVRAARTMAVVRLSEMDCWAGGVSAWAAPSRGTSSQPPISSAAATASSDGDALGAAVAPRRSDGRLGPSACLTWVRHRPPGGAGRDVLSAPSPRSPRSSLAMSPSFRRPLAMSTIVPTKYRTIRCRKRFAEISKTTPRSSQRSHLARVTWQTCPRCGCPDLAKARKSCFPQRSPVARFAASRSTGRQSGQHHRR